ncbi:MAG: peptidylprolyl isomerase [Thermodesulfobacteriota bacterium]|nr:peptidylprolyl isomerase [Thermodesulfobacteriota bacterium]
MFAFLWFAIVFVNNLYCASENSLIIVEVNGKIIDEESFQERIKALHANKPKIRPDDKQSGIKLSEIVEQMIDDCLMIQEALILNLDNDPGFKKKIGSYITTRSVIKLRHEQVLDKISISDDEIFDYFTKHYAESAESKEAPEKLKRLKKRITKTLKKEKEKELADNFVQVLKERADIRIDMELLDLLDPEKKYTGKKTVIGRVNSEPIPLDDFLFDIKQAAKKPAGKHHLLKNTGESKKFHKEIKNNVLDRLIMYKLVQQEALTRNYVELPSFADMIEKRKDLLLINDFKSKIINPLAIPAEKELRQYYNKHISDFKTGYEVWFDEMTFHTMDDAENVLHELKQGANFDFLAAGVSERAKAKRDVVWISVDRFGPSMKKELNRLEKREISNIVFDNGKYKIVKLKGKRGGEVVEFSRVVKRLERIVFKIKFDEILSDYLAKLRKTSMIKIDNEALKRIEEKYFNNSAR